MSEQVNVTKHGIGTKNPQRLLRRRTAIGAPDRPPAQRQRREPWSFQHRSTPCGSWGSRTA